MGLRHEDLNLNNTDKINERKVTLASSFIFIWLIKDLIPQTALTRNNE